MNQIKTFSPYKKFHGIYIPNWLLAIDDCSIDVKVLYGILARYAGRDTDCFPGLQRLAEEMNRSERTIRRYIDKLVELELIQKKRIGLTKTNRYSFLLNKKYISNEDFKSEKGIIPNKSLVTNTDMSPSSIQDSKYLSGQNKTLVSTPYSIDIKDSVSNKRKRKKNQNIKESSSTCNSSPISSEMEQVISYWNKTFEEEVDLSDTELIEAIRERLKSFSIAELTEAMDRRSKAEYYKNVKPEFKDDPSCFFPYPKTIRRDRKRNPDKEGPRDITYDQKIALETTLNSGRGFESGKKSSIHFEILPDKKDDQERPMWRYWPNGK